MIQKLEDEFIPKDKQLTTKVLFIVEKKTLIGTHNWKTVKINKKLDKNLQQ